MCGGGGSGSKDDNIEKVVAPVANFKPNDNPMTGYKPGDIKQERLDPIGNPTEAPKNYPGTNNEAQTCTWTFPKISSDICFIR